MEKNKKKKREQKGTILVQDLIPTQLCKIEINNSKIIVEDHQQCI